MEAKEEKKNHKGFVGTVMLPSTTVDFQAWPGKEEKALTTKSCLIALEQTFSSVSEKNNKIFVAY